MSSEHHEHISASAMAQLYQGLFDTSSLGIVAVDQGGRIVAANPALAAMFGYLPAELLGQPLELLLPAALRARHAAHRTAFVAAPRQRPMGIGMELIGQHAAGHTFPLEVSLSSIEIDGRLLSVALVAARTLAGRVEDLLRASEPRYAQAAESNVVLNRAVIGSLTAHIAVLDEDGMIVTVNRAWERFARENGDPDLARTCVGANYLAACRAASGPDAGIARAVLEGIERVLAGTLDYFTIEYPCHSPAEERWFVMHVTPLEGARRGVVVAHEDISERKRMELDVRESEERFRATFEQAPIGIAHIATTGRLLRLNQRLCDIIGYTREELLDRSLPDVISPDLLGLAREGSARLLANEISSYAAESRYVHKDGALIWLVVTVSLVRDAAGAPKYFVAIIEDVTARKQADERNSQLVAAVDSSDDAIISIAPDRIVVGWNRGAEQVYGYAAEEIIGRPAALLLPPDRVLEGRDVMDRIMRGEPGVHFESRRLRKDGRIFDAALTVSAIKDRSGRIIGASVIARDIGERKRAEQALQRQASFVHLLQTVAVAANQAATVADALQTAVDQICIHIGWPVGHVYLASEGRTGVLRSTGIWYLADPQRFALFRTLTEVVGDVAIDSLPGKVLISGAPEWIADLTANPHTPRTKLISDIGVRAGFAFPVLVGAEVVAVLEFFSADAVAPDAALLEVVAHVGTQLGRVVERERAEAALRESEARFRLLFEHAPDAIVLIDPHAEHTWWPIIECNGVACRMNGYSREELIGQSIDILNPVAPTPEERAAYFEQIRREGTIQFETLHRRKDGTFFSVEVLTSLITVAGRELVLGIDRDITERKRSEEALRAAEARYRSLVEQLPAIIYTADIDEHSSTGYVSPQIESILGFTPEEWLADPQLWLKQVHPDDRDAVLASVEQAQASDTPVPAEYRAIKRDGRVVWLQDAGRVVRDETGKPLFLQGITLDITARKQAEAALRAAEARYRTLVEQLPAIIYAGNIDERSSTSYVSPQIESILGFTPEEWLADPELWLKQIHPDDRAYVLDAVAHAQSSHEPVPLEYRSFTRDGRVVWLQDASRVVRDDDGRPLFLQGITLDITERKQAEQALVEERALLARRVAERTADLSAANAELARAARLKDEFLASMSHELRTPLNAVLGLSEALQEEVYGPLNQLQAKSLRGIEESGRHLLDLINDILDLAKIGAGKLELELGPVVVGAVCQASMRLIKQEAHKKNLSVDLTIDPDVTTLYADARRLKQILLNLLSNAVKFTPDGGALGLEVVGDKEQQAIRMTVWDTGIGIAQEDLPQLFQPFVQLDSRLARQYNGTGLGLALVYRMAEMHGGSIAVESEPGAGSRFTVSLPWQIPPGDTGAVAPQIGPAVIVHNALIIEDSPTAAAQLARYFSELGVEAITHAHGGDAVALALDLRPDLIVLDILLPDTSGWDVLRQLKADARTRPTPVLIVSVVDERSYGLSLGAADYLVKPFARQDVQQVLSRLRRARTASPAEDLAPGRATILLAEDNEVNITTMSDYLGSKGYEVVVARNGAEAVARAHETRPDLILMDIQMPGMDGLEATRRIRKQPDLSSTPIIALTALAMPGDRERCLAAGADDYLSKPVSLKGLAAAINLHLQRYTTNAENTL